MPLTSAAAVLVLLVMFLPISPIILAVLFLAWITTAPVWAPIMAARRATKRRFR